MSPQKDGGADRPLVFMERSNDGCWTCRIRHRKCDETQPRCRQCSCPTIPCHGYGPKPAWINDSVQLQQELARIKKIIKQVVRDRRMGHKRTSPEASVSAAPIITPALSLGSSSSGNNMSFRESQLLLHYLDYIFPVQFPYYVDNPQLGGRGWLFWLVMRDGPVNKALLSLSALHHHTMFADGTDSAEQELIGYHTEALQGLRRALSDQQAGGSPATNEQLVEFLACSSALISLEIFQSGTRNWHPHLCAVVKVVNDLSSWPDGTGPRPTGLENAQRFQVAESIWFDLLACTSSNAAPGIDYWPWLTERGIDMSYLMGCYNWVMIAIGDVAVIKSKGLMRIEDEAPRPLDVKNQLESGLGGLESCIELPEPRALPVSRVFASATLLELYLLCPDVFPAGFHIRDAVGQVIHAIQRVPERMSLRGLTWALCIAGSMATPDQQPFFETLMTKILSGVGSAFSNCATILHIMHYCWHQREIFPGTPFNWRDAMSALGMCALLV